MARATTPKIEKKTRLNAGITKQNCRTFGTFDYTWRIFFPKTHFALLKTFK
jgi:hypothetical protein